MDKLANSYVRCFFFSHFLSSLRSSRKQTLYHDSGKVGNWKNKHVVCVCVCVLTALASTKAVLDNSRCCLPDKESSRWVLTLRCGAKRCATRKFIHFSFYSCFFFLSLSRKKPNSLNRILFIYGVNKKKMCFFAICIHTQKKLLYANTERQCHYAI